MSAPGELTRRYLVNTVTSGLLRVASAVAGLWAARELVRALGETGFGLFTLSSALSGYLAFLGLGLPAGLVRQVARYRGSGLDERMPGLVRLALVVFGAIGALSAILLLAFDALGGLALLALPPESLGVARSVLRATCIVVLLSWPLSVFSATLTGLQRYPALNAINGAALLSAAFASVMTARGGGGTSAVVLVNGAVMAAAGLAQALLVSRSIRWLAPCPAAPSDRRELRGLLSFSAWTFALELAALLIYQTDQILLGVFVSIESLTAYYAVARLHNLIREGNGVLSSALFPLIAEEHGRGNVAAVEQAVYRGTRYAAAIVVPATLTTLLLARPFLSVWLGEPYASYAPLAQLFASYWLVAALTSFPGQVALGMGESALLGKIALTSALVNLALSLLLVRPWGIAGVVTGTLVAYALAVPAQVAFLFPRLGISRRRFLREVVTPVYGGTLPVALAWAILLRATPEPDRVFSLLGLAGLIVSSFGAVLWFAAIEPRDRERLRTTLLGARA